MTSTAIGYPVKNDPKASLERPPSRYTRGSAAGNTSSATAERYTSRRRVVTKKKATKSRSKSKAGWNKIDKVKPLLDRKISRKEQWGKIDKVHTLL